MTTTLDADAIADARAEVAAADAWLAVCESSADIRTWTREERDEWESAHYRVRRAYDALRRAKAAA